MVREALHAPCDPPWTESVDEHGFPLYTNVQPLHYSPYTTPTLHVSLFLHTNYNTLASRYTPSHQDKPKIYPSQTTSRPYFTLCLLHSRYILPSCYSPLSRYSTCSACYTHML